MNKEERTKTLINNIKININEQNVYEFGLCVEQWKQILDYIWELQKESQKYKEIIDKLSSQIKLYGKYNGEKCTRGFSMMAADFNKLLDILKEVK